MNAITYLINYITHLYGLLKLLRIYLMLNEGKTTHTKQTYK